MRGAENADVHFGSIAVIYGQGPVGLMATLGARLLGAGLLIGISSRPERLKLGKHFGADIALNYREVDPVEEIMKLTGDKGVGSVIEAVGTESTLIDSVKTTRPGGTVPVIGYFGDGDYVKIPKLEWGVEMNEISINTVLCPPGGKESMKRLLPTD